MIRLKLFEKKWLLQQLFQADTDLIEKSDDFSEEVRCEKLLVMKGLLEQHQIPFFLVLGTCLGAVREKKFIAYDHDIDIAFYDHDAHQLKAILPILKEAGFYIEEVCPCNLRLRLKESKATMDLWIIHQVKNPFQKLMGYKWLYNNGLFKEDYFNEKIVNTIDFIGFPFRIPHLQHTYLEEHYGPSWRVPQKGMHAIYRGKLSQLLISPFLTSDMPTKFSGTNHKLTYRVWVSKILKQFLPNAKITHKHLHPH